MTITRRLITMLLLTALLLTTSSVALATELHEEEAHSNGWSKRSIILTPSMGAYAGWLMGESAHEGMPAGTFRPSAWAGAAINMPSPSEFAYPYISVIAEVEPRRLADGAWHAHVSPVIHIGVAAPSVEEGASPRYVDHMFAGARMYLIAGMRPAPPGVNPPKRIGMGLSSTWFPVAALQGGFFLPSHYELVTEIDGQGNMSTLMRVGIGF